MHTSHCSTWLLALCLYLCQCVCICFFLYYGVFIICHLHSRCPSNEADPQRLAALHCLLVYMGTDPNLELKVRRIIEFRGQKCLPSKEMYCSAEHHLCFPAHLKQNDCLFVEHKFRRRIVIDFYWVLNKLTRSISSPWSGEHTKKTR